jgi:large subunit ribosomal protein L10
LCPVSLRLSLSAGKFIFRGDNVPTEAKIEQVGQLKDKLERSAITVTAGYSGMPAASMTDLRQRLRAVGVELVVVKNTLLSLAADAAQRPQVKEILQGPTAVAFGFGDPVAAAKALQDYIRTTRSLLTIQGAVLGAGPALPAAEVERLASLPPKPQLVASLLGQLQMPIASLLSVLNGPLRGLDNVLQGRIRQMESAAAPAPGG